MEDMVITVREESDLRETLEYLIEDILRQCEESEVPFLMSVAEEFRARSTTGYSAAEREIRSLFLKLGAPDHLSGHPYAVRAILLVLRDPELQYHLISKLYPQVAMYYATTPERVERAIRHLVDVTWMRCDYDVRNQYFGGTVDAYRGKPTCAEFIARMANVVRERIWDRAMCLS